MTPLATWPGFPIRIGKVVLCIRQCTEEGLNQGAYRMEGVYDDVAIINLIKCLCYGTYGFNSDNGITANLSRFLVILHNLKFTGPFTVQFIPTEDVWDSDGKATTLGFANRFPWVGELFELDWEAYLAKCTDPLLAEKATAAKRQEATMDTLTPEEKTKLITAFLDRQKAPWLFETKNPATGEVMCSFTDKEWCA